MPSYICTSCGVGYAPSATPPAHCVICEDERQYVNAAGQGWTTFEALQKTHANEIRETEPGLFGIATNPAVAIGQRALFIAQPGGGVLWDCTALVSEAAIARINELGGLRAITISHPHFYSTMVDWSEAFGGVPIHLHETNRDWVMRPSERVRYWSGETLDLGQGIRLIRCGGHFPGSTALHWAAGAGGKGVLMAGDTIMVVPDTRWLSFMYSYPNLVPLSAREVERIAATVAPYAFERIYSGWWDRVCERDAKERLQLSVERYVASITYTHKIYLSGYLETYPPSMHLRAIVRYILEKKMNGHHHHDPRWDRGWRRFEAMARRGWGRIPGMGKFGDWDGFGENFRIGRMLASGDLRLVALYLIEQQPRHGYDLIKAIEEKSQGFYSPSPGIVYPALTFLEEAGYVISAAEGKKKLYTITEEGREHLSSNREAIEATLDFLGKAGERMNKLREMQKEGWPFSEEQREKFREMKEPGWPLHRQGRPDRDIRDVLPELNEARRELKAAIADAIALGEDEQRRVAEVLRRAAAEIRGSEDDVDLG